MSLKIDKEKTIQKERMIFKRNWEYYFDKISEIIIYSLWTVSTIAIVLNPKNAINQYAAIAIISVNILLLVSWYYIYKLVKIEIPNPEINRKLFVEIVSKRFPDLQINDQGSNSLRSIKTVGLLNWGKSLMIIFDQNYVFINLTTLGRFETKSPFHSIVNYLKLKSIKKDFYAIINVNQL